MSVLAKVTVQEESGIRRFLYPLSIDLVVKKGVTEEIAVNDESGGLLPSETVRARGKVTVNFALSLAPFEKKKLEFFTSTETGQVPDPLLTQLLDDGRTVVRQERLATTLLPSSEIESVIYDGFEHLAGPVKFTLNAESPADDIIKRKSFGGELTFRTIVHSRYPANDRKCVTDVSLSACKSWARVAHTVDQPAPGSIISLDIPLTPPADGEIPTCDFGLGNGVYSKIDTDHLFLEADFFGKKPYNCWQVSRLTEGIQRIDYAGGEKTAKSFIEALHFHWTLAGRSLAVAVTELPSSASHFQALIGRDGRIHISAVLGDIPLRKAKFSVVLHFLNDIPAIAAATNPASILSPPFVVVR